MGLFLFHDLDKRICLTCQYYLIERNIKVVGRQVFIEHSGKTGNCSIFNNFPRALACPANSTSYCHYKRWNELP